MSKQPFRRRGFEGRGVGLVETDSVPTGHFPYRHRRRTVGHVDVGLIPVESGGGSLPSSNMTFWFTAAEAYTDAGKTTKCSVDGDMCYTLKDLAPSSPLDAVQEMDFMRPGWYSNGPNSLPYLLFDARELYNARSWPDPITLYLVIRQDSYIDDSAIIGSNGTYRGVTTRFSSPEICLLDNSGTHSGQDTNLAVGSWGLLITCFNGASSYIKVNNATQTNIVRSASDGTGLKIGYAAWVGGYANFSVAEIACYSAAHNPASGDGLLVRQSLNAKYNLY